MTGTLAGFELLLRIDHRDGGDIDDVLDFGSALQQMYRLRHARQDRANRLRRHPVAVSSLQAMLQDCRSGKISTLAPPCQRRERKRPLPVSWH